MNINRSARRLLPPMAALALAASQPAPASTANEPDPMKETRAQFDARTKWWREARFGMFIHWGLYAVPADATDKNGNKRIAEWYLSNKQMQVKDYEKFAAQFNPVKFDARRWVKTAKDAGMKYIVITSKHHDGFCLWDSKYTDYCVTKATPFKRDILKELAAECKRQGIRLCFYHSIMDWHHPDYLPRRPWEKGVRDAAGANPDRYFEHMKLQIAELVRNYGPLGVMWFDGEWENTWTHARGLDLYRYVRSLQPSILVNNRVDKGRQGMQGMTKEGGFAGDFGTPEQEIPPTGFPDGRLWESCMTMNDTWGYARNDHNWKSAEDLIRKLCDIASKGGNFLLNVGPTELGEFPDAINERLAAMAVWMKVNSRSIHGTTAGPYAALPFNGRTTVKGSSLFVQVFEWPDSGIKLPGLRTPVRQAVALMGGENLAVTQTQDGVTVSKPSRLDPYATVIELKLAGAPVVARANVTASR